MGGALCMYKSIRATPTLCLWRTSDSYARRTALTPHRWPPRLWVPWDAAVANKSASNAHKHNVGVARIDLYIHNFSMGVSLFMYKSIRATPTLCLWRTSDSYARRTALTPHRWPPRVA